MEATDRTPQHIAPPPDRSSAPQEPGLAAVPSWVSFAAVVVALVPIVVATVRAIRSGWLPIGDNAFFGIRARDVFTSHPPLLGTWTSASLTVGRNINNPGPLLFDLLAVPVTVFGTAGGLAFGVALINGAAVVGIAGVAHRRGGPLLVTAAMLVATVLGWTMGSELLFDPWQPHILLLPFLCFLVLAWTMSCGDLWALPWMLFVGSLLVQTHLTYAYLVPALGLWSIVGLGLVMRRRLRDDPDAARALRRRIAIVTAVSVAVVVACWLQPLVEELTGDGTGNLTRLVQTLNDPRAEVVGYGRASRIMATVLSEPPLWFRPSFANAFPDAAGVPASSLATLAALVLVLGLCIRTGRRRRDRDVTHAAVTAMVALAAGFYTAAKIPITVFGIAPHQFRWLWPLGAFTGFVILAAVTRALAARAARRGSPVEVSALAATLAALALVVAVLNLPKTPSPSGSAFDAWAIPVMQDVDRQLGGLAAAGPLLYDFRDIQFAEPYSTAIMAELQRRRVPFVVDVAGLTRQLGPHRRFDGHNARNRILYRLGDDALTTPPNSERVALHEGLTQGEQRELERLYEDIGAYVRDGSLRLTAKGRSWVDEGRLPALARRGDVVDGGDVEALFRYRALGAALAADLLVVDPEWRGRFEQYGELQRRWDRETIAVFVAPMEELSARPARDS